MMPGLGTPSRKWAATNMQ